ncbi:TetR/AcrR family transcriptional regulator [Actinocatenispora rupis]|nr:TetR/AcrR family transcriptional regulator [Actinocatenispora rupis]
MPRQPKFSRDDVLDAARDAVFEHWRSATVSHVTSRLGAPSGSIYHRFASREALFVTAWIRSVRRFQQALTTIVEIPDPTEAIVETALHIPRFCRQHRKDARMMTLYRHADLLTTAPPELREELAGLNTPVATAIAALTRRRYGRVTNHGLAVMRLACRDSPYGIVRPIIGEAIPAWIDDAVRATTGALAGLPDHT